MNQSFGYLALRLILGVNFLAHGLVRIGDINGFSSWMVEKFATTPLPGFLVYGFASSLSVLELAVGALLIAGLWTRLALLVGSLQMVALIFGSCLIQNWEWVGFQMIYGLYFGLLLFGLQYNQFSLDERRKCK